MTFTMDLKEAKFTLADLIKIVTYSILGTLAWATLKDGVGNLREDVAEIREAQIENTKRNEARWGLIEAKQNQIDMQYRLLEQRVEQIEKKRQ